MRNLLFVPLFLLPMYSFANVIMVCKQCPVTGIGAAIQLAEEGDTILVKRGIYQEFDIKIDKCLTLIGQDWPVVEGGNQSEVFSITAPGVVLEGFQIQNTGASQSQERAGIRVKNTSDFRIRRNRLLNTYFGIYLEYSREGIVENNYIKGEAVSETSSGNAVHAWYCKQITVRGNNVYGHRDGIYFEFVDSSWISHNYSEANVRYGLHFMFSNDDRYFHNTFRRNGSGVAVMFSKRIDMLSNRFEHNWGTAAYGLLLKEIYDASISDNHFERNTIGIFMEGAARIKYENNTFSNNGVTLKMMGGCIANHFKRNYFFSNTLDLVVEGNTNDNSFDGNYWSEYTGYDLNRDGVGDVPYRPVKLFAYVMHRCPESVVLLRSFFVDLLNLSEKISPAFTPANVLDNEPLMHPVS
ncbi:MAG: nitrous oxide reductase family maturation protein NosD [Saprospiraceae bacterium]|jgi:nitrous oxidase accessory protein|nr:nitrous oxide reductase family maturation protein NosD [Saprospiraceae bacterium]